jgi:hypothetical protein
LKDYGGASRDRTDDLIVANDGVCQINSFACSCLDAEYGPLRSNSTTNSGLPGEVASQFFRPASLRGTSPRRGRDANVLLPKLRQIGARDARLVQQFHNFRSRDQSILVKQTQARNESESFAKLSALRHSRPRTFRSDLFTKHDCTDICSPRYISTFSKSLIQRYFSRTTLGGGGGESLSTCSGDRVPGFRACLHFNGFLLFVENVFQYFQRVRAKMHAKWRFLTTDISSTFSK